MSVLRTPLQMEEVPYAVSVNGVQEIQVGKPGLSVEEGLRLIPGVQVDNRHNYALGERISIRGFGARSQFGVRGVRVFLEGIPATLPDGQSSLTNIDVKTLGRVEVVRGPAASLYGNTAGGVIQMEMQQPPPVPFSQQFEYIGGSNGLSRLSSTTSGLAEGAAYQLNFTRFSTDGYRQHSSARNLYLNGRLGFDGERDRVRVVVSVGDTDALNPGSLSQAQQEQDRFQAFQNNINFRTGKTIQEGMIGASWIRDVSPGSLEVAGYLIQREVVNPIPQDVIDLRRAGGGARALFRSDRMGPLGIQLSVGAEMDRQEDDRKEFANVSGERGELSIDQLEQVDNAGIYGQVAAHPFQRLSLLGGLRYDWFEFSADDRFVSQTDPDDSGTRTMEAFSPSLGATFAVTENAHIYGNIGKTFETPTTVELGNRAGGAGGLNPDLDPQEATSYELGVRTLLADRLAIQLAAYQADVKNSLIPFQVPDAPGRDYYQNAASATHRGIEVGATAVPIAGITVHGAYTLTDATFDNFVDRNGNQHGGNDVPGVAKHRLEGVLTVAPSQVPAFFAIESRHVSKIAANDANTAFSPSYTLVDIRAGLDEVALGPVLISPFGGITNLFDRDYNTSVAINAFGGRFFESGPGRSFYLGGSARVLRR